MELEELEKKGTDGTLQGLSRAERKLKNRDSGKKV